jgi:hypothetical protein
MEPVPGLYTMEASWDDLLTLKVNVTPRPGHQPFYQWLLVGTSKDSTLYLVTPAATVKLKAGMDVTAWTYPFTPQPAIQAIGKQRLRDLGLVPGDQLYYAYAYTPSDDLQTLIVDNIVAINIQAADTTLGGFDSSLSLANYLKQGLLNANAQHELHLYFSPPLSPVAGGDPQAPAFSVTNVQEAGVDEADLTKSDGSHLYIAPAAELGLDFATAADVSASNRSVRIMAVSDDPAQAVQIGTIPLSAHDEWVDGLYLIRERGPDLPDLLVTVGGGTDGYGQFWPNPWYWYGGQTEIGLYNVDSPARSAKIALLRIDGHLIASRRIGDTLYLVTRFTPQPEGFEPLPVSPEDIQLNQDILDGTTLADLLPGWSLDGVSKGNLVGTDACYLPPYDGERPAQPSIITVTAIPLATPGRPVSKAVVGPTETVYVSSQSLFLATTRHSYFGPMLPTVGGLAASIAPPLPPEETDIHQFDLTSGQGFAYRGSGTVLGHLGWESDKRPFRLSQYQGVLRVATSLGDTWDLSAQTRLTMLKPRMATPSSEGASLQTLSYIDGIGEIGERLYAVRFAAARAYLVTFRVTDPLYVFDLTDPYHPKQLGELHIDGYADYLHLVGDDLLLGIGKDAVPDSGANDFGGRGAWYQGVKLSLFDISDPQRPTEIDRIVLGKRGTESDALHDHHAFTYLPPTEAAPARLAIPLRLHSTTPVYAGFDPSKPWSFYDWTHTGLYLFDIYTGLQAGHMPGLTSRGTLIIADRAQGDNEDPWSYAWSDRSLILGDSVHYTHNSRVWSAPWDAPAAAIGPQ